MSSFIRIDDFVLRPGYDYTPPGLNDFIFKDNSTNSSPPTEDNVSTISSPSEHPEDISPTPSFNNNNNYIFSTKYENSVTSPTIVDPTPPVVVNIFENVPAHYVLLIPARPLYDGGVYNQPSRNQIRERKLKPLTVGSEAWLAHMEEIYNIHLENLQYDLDKKAAISQWNTTDEKERKDLLKKMQKAEEDEEILTHLRERIAHIDHVIYIKYHREEVGLKFHPCAVMDDRILK
ncbi:hypothetical protein RhiirA5_410075 [Rhizophagus irregularis]|uniref:Uncharacterized protein n=1 Tax=Rhizophagus irregularis TaxID=588596 RepID=A0A2N0Q4C2_9GLOM|nr:hypothetical protein RhiirA5_410075 [Rhizophagus irregularis]